MYVMIRLNIIVNINLSNPLVISNILSNKNSMTICRKYIHKLEELKKFTNFLVIPSSLKYKRTILSIDDAKIQQNIK